MRWWCTLCQLSQKKRRLSLYGRTTISGHLGRLAPQRRKSHWRRRRQAQDPTLLHRHQPSQITRPSLASNSFPIQAPFKTHPSCTSWSSVQYTGSISDRSRARQDAIAPESTPAALTSWRSFRLVDSGDQHFLNAFSSIVHLFNRRRLSRSLSSAPGT